MCCSLCPEYSSLEDSSHPPGLNLNITSFKLSFSEPHKWQPFSCLITLSHHPFRLILSPYHKLIWSCLVANLFIVFLFLLEDRVCLSLASLSEAKPETSVRCMYFVFKDRAPLSITEIKRFSIGIRACLNMGGPRRVKVKKTEVGRSGTLSLMISAWSKAPKWFLNVLWEIVLPSVTSQE